MKIIQHIHNQKSEQLQMGHPQQFGAQTRQFSEEV